MERKYIGFWDDGHDKGQFYYYSKHRNYSKRNMEDMKSTYFSKYGYSKRNHIRFNFGILVNGEWLICVI